MRVTFHPAAPLKGQRPTIQPHGLRAFSLVELLVVIAIIAILASLLMPTMATTKSKVQGTSCINNFKQLQIAWQLYTLDYHDSLPANQWMSVDWEDGCPTGTQQLWLYSRPPDARVRPRLVRGRSPIRHVG